MSNSLDRPGFTAAANRNIATPLDNKPGRHRFLDFKEGRCDSSVINLRDSIITILMIRLLLVT